MCNKCYATISDDLLTYERTDLYDEDEDYEEDILSPDDYDYRHENKLDSDY
jgi:hypothetical protein